MKQPDIQPNQSTQANNTIKRIANKEISLFFSSPIGYLFLATFAAITLFIFFWGESFFARNIADVRPLFEWMPVLLIFLSATITMRLWSEERRSGTLEYVLTQGVPLWNFVLGKFIGCLMLLLIALLITLPMPITVAMMGDLDWGPVWSGYLATLLLGAAYLSIGLFISAKSDNQIVSLICASVVCGIFYLIGAPTLTDLFGSQMAEYMRLLGTGSRFESITRGMIDFRDLYYYVSIIIVFLVLNTLVLERERWICVEKHQQPRNRHQRWRNISGLIIINVLAVNVWLYQLTFVRVDTTQGQQYSLSDASKNYLHQLQEPLLIRGYFSAKTHPLLAPLVPQMRDLIKEYEIAGNNKVRIEFIDPLTNPEQEEEASQKYGIRPVPFQVADRYQSAIVSSYFNIVLQYGDQHQVLGFSDLIEVKSQGVSNIEVQLRNPEYDLTKALRKVVNSYQAGGNLFDTLNAPITFTGYISENSQLPKQLVEFKTAVSKHLEEVKNTSSGQFNFEFIDPQANGGQVAKTIAKQYGFAPMATNLFSEQQFYFYMVLNSGDQKVQIPFTNVDNSAFERNLSAAIKRFARGFTKTVALVTPSTDGAHTQFGAQGAQFNQLRELLSGELNVESDDLTTGYVNGNADVLVLSAPENLDEKQLFAVDQFLMQGGTVIAATSPYKANLGSGRLSLTQQTTGLNDWLLHHGIQIEKSLVLDQQNSAFPIPITRQVGGIQIQDMRMFDYPFFVDVRANGLNQENLITSDLPQVTIPWASPITVVESKQNKRKVTPLIESSNQSWLTTSTDIMPKITPTGGSGFNPTGEQKSHTLAVVSEGIFSSYFADKTSPLIENNQTENSEETSTVDKSDDNKDEGESSNAGGSSTPELALDRVIKNSPATARLIVISSNELANDQVLRFLSNGQQSEYLNSLQLVANTVDWALSDASLLSIRSRSHFNRTLIPMEQSEQMIWEYMNYGLAVFALVVIALVMRRKWQKRKQHYTRLFLEQGA